MSKIRLEEVSFNDIEGWDDDNLVEAVPTFARSFEQFSNSLIGTDQIASYAAAVKSALGDGSSKTARQFFETFFVPHRIASPPEAGLVTGYYEPVLNASWHPTATFRYPIYKRPPDLVDVIEDQLRGAKNGVFTHMRQTPDGLRKFPTRREIDQGALDGRGLELAYVEDPVDLFFLHIQGSGLLRFADSQDVRVTYDGKNGFPYTSVGRHMIAEGLFGEAELTMHVMIAWLKADLLRARALMWVNESYVFFRQLSASDPPGPLGVGKIQLTPGRSLAVDAGHHKIGTPIYVTAGELKSLSNNGFSRLMIAQDVGSAIKGQERGDIYYGTGDSAGQRAGVTKCTVKFHVLLPAGQYQR